MNNHFSLSLDCTSAKLEENVLRRYRQGFSFLSYGCHIFREPWDCSTVLCFDCADSPHLMPSIQSHYSDLLNNAQSLGLAKEIILRLGHKFVAWQR